MATPANQASYTINAQDLDVAIVILRSVLPGTSLVTFLLGFLLCQYGIILTRQTTSKPLHAVLALLVTLNMTLAVTAILVRKTVIVCKAAHPKPLFICQYMRHFAIDLLISTQRSLPWKGCTLPRDTAYERSFTKSD
jgi:hypothetical protein